MNYQAINGWTKAGMVDHIKANFKGKSVVMHAYTKREKCVYRGPNGTKCAVGLFIPDELYQEIYDLECYMSVALPDSIRSSFPLDLYGMQDLQAVHDCSPKQDTLERLLSWIEQNVTESQVS